MALKAILFDLDGTLLPLDQDQFVETYFKSITAFMAGHGYDSKEIFDTVWKGTYAMMKNTGTKPNEAVFWDTVSGIYGEKIRQDMPLFEAFYQQEFDCLRSICGFDPKAARTVRKLKEEGYQVVLATNPVFPAVATEKRIRWAGLEPEDFAFVTTYENSSYAKPNLDYYREVLKRLNLAPEECLMVGNDTDDDMPAGMLGMQVFLLPACLLNKSGKSLSAYPQGDFDDLLAYIRGQKE